MVITSWIRLFGNRLAFHRWLQRIPGRRGHTRRRQQPITLHSAVEVLEDRTLLSNVAFAVSGSPSVTEDLADGDGNLAEYTISYTGDLESGETVRVDIAQAFDQTSSADFTNTLVAHPT